MLSNKPLSNQLPNVYQFLLHRIDLVLNKTKNRRHGTITTKEQRGWL